MWRSLLDGSMAGGLAGDELMVRSALTCEETGARPHTRPLHMTGRLMKGWIRVVPDALDGEPALANWVSQGVALTRSLPSRG